MASVTRCDLQAAEAPKYQKEILLLLDADWAMPDFETVGEFLSYCREWHGAKISEPAIIAIYEAARLASAQQL